MLDEARQDEACRLLLDHWAAQTRLDALPQAMRPATRAEGYAIQARLEATSHAPLFGWKIAATSKAGQEHIAVDGPLAGRLLAERIVPDGGTIALGNTRMRVAEVEFAFRMGRDLPPRAAPYSVAEVMDAVAALHPAIEVPDSRYEDFTKAGAPQLIADNACAHLFVLGPAMTEGWRTRDLAAEKPVGRVTGRLEREGLGANVLGDPRIGLAWLANELSGLGITLKAGEVVTTGTCLVPIEVQPGDEVVGDFGDLGRVSVRFTA
jgi:2-keto-4-pentenoate hydratase